MTENKTEKLLKPEVEGIQSALNELKNTTLSNAEKEKKANEIRERINNEKNAIENRILELKDKTDEESIAEKEKAEVLLKTLTDTVEVQLSVLTQQSASEASQEAAALQSEVSSTSSSAEVKGDSESDEKKGIGNWLKEHWKGLSLGTLGLGGLLWWRKKKKQKEESKEESDKKESSDKKEEKSFRDRPFGKIVKGIGIGLGIGSGVYYVAHGIYTGNRNVRDLWDWEKGKKLEFEEAIKYASGCINGQNNENSMSYGLGLAYNESTSEIEAYGEKIKIDKNKRKIDGLNIEFKKYEHLICAAVLIAYLKKTYSGKCASNTPFNRSGSRKGNINVDGDRAVDGTGIGGKIAGVSSGGILGIIAGIYGGLPLGAAVGVTSGVVGYAIGDGIDKDNILKQYMPELDGEYGCKSLSAYLNGLNCRETRNQTSDDVRESSIKPIVVECMEEIKNQEPDSENRGGERKLDAIPDPNNPNRYTIESYNTKLLIETTGNSADSEVKILGMSSDSDIKIDTSKLAEIGNLKLKEIIYLANFIGFILKDNTYKYQGTKSPYWYYGSRGMGVKKGLYFSDSGLDERVLTADQFEKKMPSIYKEKDKFIEFLNNSFTGISSNISIWKKKK